jgi:hypothetical protein
MAVAAADIIIRLSANHATADTGTQGGAVDATGQVLQDQFTAAARPEFDSDNAGDTMNCTVVGRLASGIIATETLALTGTSARLFANSFLRILSVTFASPATGTITMAEGTGGTVRHTFLPGDDLCRTLFYGAYSEPSGGGDQTRYEKVFISNEHATDSALNLTVELTTDPRTDYDIVLEDAVDDNESVANRKTAPTGISGSFGDGPHACVNTDLDAAEVQGMWVKQVLAAGTASDVDEPVITLSFATI